MSTTGQVATFSDLVADLRSRLRAHSTTEGDNVLKRLINMAHQDIYIGARERMPWAERQATLITQPSYSDGTVSVSQGSTTLTGSGTLWNTANAFGAANMRTTGRVVLGGGREVYELSAVGSDTSATLASRFTQDTLSGETYTYFEDEYDLASDFLRVSDPSFRFFDQARALQLIERNEFRRRFVSQRVPGKPTCCTIVDKAPSGNTTPIRRVLFNVPTDQAYSFPYTYITKNIVVSSAGVGQTEFTADSDEPIIPFGFRHLISVKALYFAFRDRRDDMNRANAANAEFIDLWLRVANDYEGGQSRPRMAAQVGSYFGRARRPFSGGRTNGVVSGSAFDEFRE